MFDKEIDQYLILLESQLNRLEPEKRDQVLREVKEALVNFVKQNPQNKSFRNIIDNFPNVIHLSNYYKLKNNHPVQAIRAVRGITFFKGCLIILVIIIGFILFGVNYLKLKFDEFFKYGNSSSSFHYKILDNQEANTIPPQGKDYISVFKGDFETINHPNNIVKIKAINGNISVKATTDNTLTYSCNGSFYQSSKILVNQNNNWNFNFSDKDQVDCHFEVPHLLKLNLDLNNGVATYTTALGQEQHLFNLNIKNGNVVSRNSINEPTIVDQNTTIININVLNGRIDFKN